MVKNTSGRSKQGQGIGSALAIDEVAPGLHAVGQGQRSGVGQGHGLIGHDHAAGAQELGQTLLSRFQELQENHEVIGEVRGKGPMLAMELVQDRETKAPSKEAADKLVKFCFDKGLVLLSCGTHGNVIRTLMPLVITDEQLERGLSIMEEGFQQLTA